MPFQSISVCSPPVNIGTRAKYSALQKCFTEMHHECLRVCINTILRTKRFETAHSTHVRKTFG